MTWYPISVAPMMGVGAFQETVAERSPGVAVGESGAPGRTAPPAAGTGRLLNGTDPNRTVMPFSPLTAVGWPDAVARSPSRT